jgi:D-alanine-D-alanine ligase-like ATP-grasp enzyme
MMAAARAIGGPLHFVRIDFLLDDDETPYLGEVTFTPGHGAIPIRHEMDVQFGSLWDLRAELSEVLTPLP